MIFYPNLYCKNVLEISVEILKKNNIKGLVLDVDNTLIDIDRNMDPRVKDWVENMKKNDIKLCIVSNTNKVDKVTKVAQTLDLPFFYFAKKPLKGGFKKAQKLLNIDFKNMAAVGDQIMTDVIGSNRCKMFSILVDPLSTRDIFITKVKRPIEKIIINRYLSKLEKEKG